MTARQSPNEALPIVQRVRLRYAKTGRMRFASHRDFQRALERAVRRAEVPIAWSGGFSPHPRISYANAAPTGAASHAEYVELGLARAVDPVRLRAELSEGLPAGFTIEETRIADATALADRLEASCWQLELPGLDATALSAAVDRMLASGEVTVPRMTKSGPRDIAVSGNWVRHDVEDGRLTVVLRHDTPNVRPEDVVTALALTPTASPVYTRLAQGPLVGHPPEVGDPLAAAGVSDEAR